HDISPRVDSLPPAVSQPRSEHEREQGHRQMPKTGVHDIDTVVQTLYGPPAIPAPIMNFPGINVLTSGCNCAPPDTNGEAGPTYYVQSVNAAFQIFNKSTGVPTGAPVQINSL